MPLDPETVKIMSWSLGSLIGGLIAGGTAINKWLTKKVTNLGLDNVYLSKIQHASECKVTKLEGQIALRETLDEIFKLRDEKLDDRFDKIMQMVEDNRKVVIEHYSNVVAALQELKRDN